MKAAGALALLVSVSSICTPAHAESAAEGYRIVYERAGYLFRARSVCLDNSEELGKAALRLVSNQEARIATKQFPLFDLSGILTGEVRFNDELAKNGVQATCVAAR